MQIRSSYFVPQMGSSLLRSDCRSAFVSRILQMSEHDPLPNLVVGWNGNVYRHARICSFLVFSRPLHCATAIHVFFAISHGNGRLISARQQTPSSYEIENRVCRVQEETCEGNFPQPACPQLRLIALVLQYLHVLKSTLNLTPCLYSAEKRSRAVDIVSDEVSHVCIHLRIPSRFTRPKGARRP